MEGILFYIRNEFGKQLYEIFEGIVDPSWYWSVAPEEAYFADPVSGLGAPFFGETDAIMDGSTFMNHISSEDYLLIFADIKAFPSLESVVEITDEKEFMESTCKLGLIVSDSAQVIVYSRDKQLLLNIVDRAKSVGYEGIKFMERENLIAAVWGWLPKD